MPIGVSYPSCVVIKAAKNALISSTELFAAHVLVEVCSGFGSVLAVCTQGQGKEAIYPSICNFSVWLGNQLFL